jgi:hypothetical protein
MLYPNLLCLPISRDLAEPFIIPKHPATSTCTHPICAACCLAKQKSGPAGTQLKSNIKERNQSLSSDALKPGQVISFDHYILATTGRLPNSCGSKSSLRYCGGTLYVDHATHFVFANHPCYVLDPKLRDAKKIPKWKVWSVLGQFMGFSPEHSSTIGHIKNTETGYITPQFHVVYDEKFSMVTSPALDTTKYERLWVDLFTFGRDHYLLDDDELVDKGDFRCLN